jgi:hypothetical protein
VPRRDNGCYRAPLDGSGAKLQQRLEKGIPVAVALGLPAQASQQFAVGLGLFEERTAGQTFLDEALEGGAVLKGERFEETDKLGVGLRRDVACCEVCSEIAGPQYLEVIAAAVCGTKNRVLVERGSKLRCPEGRQSVSCPAVDDLAGRACTL